MKRTLFAIGTLVASGMVLPLRAQTTTPEFRPYVGAFMPTGALRDALKTSAVYGFEAALEVTPNLHVLGTFGWSPAHDKYTGYDENVNIYAVDVGSELGLVRSLASGWELKPFLGLGVGARTYDYKSSSLAGQTLAAGYLSAGSEFQLSRIALRVEGRENVFHFRSPLSTGSNLRNDVSLLLGFAYHFR